MADGVKKINEWIMKDGRVINVTRNIDAAKLEGGTQFINPTSGLLNYVSINNIGAKAWKKYDPMVIFDTGSIKTGLIANLNITNEKIAKDSVTRDKIKDLEIINSKIANDSITRDKIKDLEIINSKIANDSITRDKIKNLEVLNSKLADSSVTSDKIANLTIININIAENTITRNKMFSKTLTDSEIANGTLTEALYKEGSVSSRVLANKCVVSSKIELKNVLRTHLADKIIGTAQLDINSINTSHISSINASVIVDKSILETKMADNSVSNRMLNSGCISYQKLDSNIKDLIDRSIRVENEVTIGSTKYLDTAFVKGNLVIKHPSNNKTSMTLYGDFNAHGTVTASKCYNPVFADLAEAYIPVERIQAGDAVSLSLEGGLKVEKTTTSNIDRFLGFVSNEYATVFGATAEELSQGKKIAVTLVGRIKIKADDEAKIGQFVYVTKTGVKFYSYRCSSAVGRVLENKSKTNKFVLCQLWP